MTGTATAKLGLALMAGFMLATVAGTLSHEGGHYLVTRSLGYRASINYQATMWYPGQKFRDKDLLPIVWGGPLQTMFTGTLGFLLLWRYRRSFHPGKPLNFGQWLLIFISLFWLRQPANLAMGIGIWLLTGRMPHSGDETRLAVYHHWPPGAVAWPSALIGIAVLFVVIFRFVPRGQRILFMIAGLLGGCAGYILWFHYLGPILMP
ncbi:hypothetical protein [Taibaiella koreensis]|uniref:hypothetical protein n=1 Tax=Taibaiella koreensis TaxID=1268548 RepID=UPI000E59C611|nr:hypothetical protein [Taibaiella koreensis]